MMAHSEQYQTILYIQQLESIASTLEHQAELLMQSGYKELAKSTLTQVLDLREVVSRLEVHRGR